MQDKHQNVKTFTRPASLYAERNAGFFLMYSFEDKATTIASDANKKRNADKNDITNINRSHNKKH
jgi:hypothetical protein